MRLGLLGDIHGNAAALRAVLEAARAAGIDTLCLTGDFVGYYYEPDTVLALLSSWTCHAVRGNHEDLLQAARLDPDTRAGYLAKYGSGLEVAMRRLEPPQMEELAQLPETLTLSIGERSLLLAHGTPWDTDVYLYPDAPVALMEKVAENEVDFIVLGHTHYQFDRTVSGRLIINPGSVGHPAIGNRERHGPSWTPKTEQWNIVVKPMTLQR